MAQLTERQQQIKTLLEQGKKAEAIGQELGISANAVYQQVRRMRKAGAKPKTGRQSARKPAAARAAAPAPNPGAASSNGTATVTPLQAVRSRRDLIQAECKQAESAVAAIQKSLDAAKEQASKVKARHADELKALDKAESALKPAPRPSTPAKPAKARTAPRKRRNAANRADAGTQVRAEAAKAAAGASS